MNKFIQNVQLKTKIFEHVVMGQFIKILEQKISKDKEKIELNKLDLINNMKN